MKKKEKIRIVLEGSFDSSQEKLRKQGFTIKVNSKLIKKLLKRLK